MVGVDDTVLNAVLYSFFFFYSHGNGIKFSGENWCTLRQPDYFLTFVLYYSTSNVNCCFRTTCVKKRLVFILLI